MTDVERRYDANGDGPYTKGSPPHFRLPWLNIVRVYVVEFVAFYGGSKEWFAARVSPTNGPYSSCVACDVLCLSPEQWHTFFLQYHMCAFWHVGIRACWHPGALGACVPVKV